MEQQPLSTMKSFEIPSGYNFDLSSEANYCCSDAPFVGKYKNIRSLLDYSYHKHYSVERQLLHDKLIDRFLKTIVHDRKSNLECEVPLENWIVFTAGPMGAGKGHTMQWLFKNDLFPLDAFVNVDPDAIRLLLPETAHYNERDDNTAGYLTQKEVGYISEVLSYDALLKGKNVLVDGSLRNAHWYLEYFKNLREKFPVIKIAILHVTARPETVLLRARNRALVTGRHVPEETILESMHKIPESLAVLSRHAEFVATFVNEDEEPEPRLGQCCMQERSNSGPSCRADCEAQTPMTPLWCIQELNEAEMEDSSTDGDGLECASPRAVCNNSDDRETQLSCTMCYEIFHRNNSSSLTQQQGASGTVATASEESTATQHLSSCTVGNSNNAHNKRKGKRWYKLTECAPAQVTALDSWKEHFSRVWEMKCALPAPHLSAAIATGTASPRPSTSTATAAASATTAVTTDTTTTAVAAESATISAASAARATCTSSECTTTTSSSTATCMDACTEVNTEHVESTTATTTCATNGIANKFCLKQPLEGPASDHLPQIIHSNSEHTVSASPSSKKARPTLELPRIHL